MGTILKLSYFLNFLWDTWLKVIGGVGGFGGWVGGCDGSDGWPLIFLCQPLAF